MKKFITLFLALILLTLTACANTDERNLVLIPDGFKGLSVNYLDVGNSNAVFIKLPDGKTMLIDSGEYTENNCAYIKSVLLDNAERIDYLVVSNPSDRQLGNAFWIADDYEISKAFVPYIKDGTLFPTFNAVYQKLISKSVDITVSDYTRNIKGEDYFIGFLAPLPFELEDSAYNDLATETNPDSDKIHGVSAVVYLEYKGVRFLFTSNASQKTERVILDNYGSGLYDICFGKGKINLDKIDFLMVSNHGSNNATCLDFLSLVKPRNAIISVGTNYYGYPSTTVINRLFSSNVDLSLYRTDLNGTVTALVDTDGEYLVKSAS